jgi:hypothetical protein
MELNNVEFRVLVKGKPITEYAHNGDIYVEGREGSEFELEIINKNPYRVEAVVTVDGLSVVDGKEGSPESSGYLVEANSTVRESCILRIPGWKLDNEQAAKFVFSGNGSKSYAAQMTGSSRNNGVIGCMVFAERYRRPVTKTRERPTPNVSQHPVHGHLSQHPTHFWNGQQSVSMGYVDTSHSTAGSITKGLASLASTQGAYATSPSSTASMASANMMFAAAQNSATMDWMDQEQERGGKIEDYWFSPRDKTRATQVQSLNNLGTGFGNATTFETETISFDRGQDLGVFIIYYDNARGLKARGIQVGRNSRVKHTAKGPQAFPGLVKGCPIPPGWKG